MANGKDERHNPKRKVSKQEKGMTTFDMGGGATVQRILSPEAQRAESKPVGFDTQDYDNAHRCESCGVTGGGVGDLNGIKMCQDCASQ